MSASGEAHYLAKLTDQDVRLIREAAIERRRLRQEAARLSNAALAEKFGVKLGTILSVLSFNSWRHVR